MGLTEIIVLIVIGVVVIAAARVLLQGVVVVLAIAAVAVLLGGYSFTQLREDAGKAVKRGTEITCPADAAVQLRAAQRRMALVQRALAGQAIGPQRRDDLEVESATLRAKIARLRTCTATRSQ
jgi:hypothetical protein